MTDYDRTAEDVGNVLLLEHLNLTVPDQELAALFYVSGLGFTRDPYLDFGGRNMWINVGLQQFHLPKAEAQRFRGEIGIVVPDFDGLQRRLYHIGGRLKDTAFGYTRTDNEFRVRCPWGNRFRIREPAPGGMKLGIAWLDMQVPPGAAPAIAAFYREVIGCPATCDGDRARVAMGRDQTLWFSETAEPIADYDGHHIAVYVADFSGPHRKLAEAGLITEESDAHQYRFQALFDPATGTAVTALEHEVRSLRHPMYGRHLVNRDPSMNVFNFRNGEEALAP